MRLETRIVGIADLHLELAGIGSGDPLAEREIDVTVNEAALVDLERIGRLQIPNLKAFDVGVA